MKSGIYLGEVGDFIYYELSRGVGALEKANLMLFFLLLKSLIAGVFLMTSQSQPKIILLLAFEYHLWVSEKSVFYLYTR